MPGKGKKKSGDKAASEEADKVEDVIPAQTEEELSLAEECRILEKQIAEETELADYFGHLSKLTEQNIEGIDKLAEKEFVEIHRVLSERDHLESAQQSELYDWQNRVRNVLSEFQCEMTEARVYSETVLQDLAKHYRQIEHREQQINRGLIQRQKATQQRHSQLCANLRRQFGDERLFRLREEFEHRSETLKRQAHDEMRTVRQECLNERERKVRRLENEKKVSIDELIAKHKRELAEIQRYYNDITVTNLEMIKSLKQNLSETQVREKSKEQQLLEMAHINRHLSEPLKVAMIRVESLSTKLETYAKERIAAQKIQEQVDKLKQSCENLQWDNYTLIQELNKNNEQIEQIKKQLEQSKFDKREKENMYQTVLSQKTAVLKGQVSKLTSVLTSLGQEV